MPRSDELAAIFQNSGRDSGGDTSSTSDVDVCDVRNLTSILGHDAQGSSAVVPSGVDYDRKPWLQNPGAIVDDNVQYDPEGRKK